MADIPSKQFFGTAQTVINTATDIASLNFSGAPAASPTTFTQFINCTDSSVNRKTSGQPGIGFYASVAGAVGNKGWTDFSVVAV